MFNEYLTTARILEIIKDDMTFCSSRVIVAKLKIEKSGEIISVQWANSPTVIGITSFWKSKAMECFDRAWECEKGEMVNVYNPRDEYASFFDKISGGVKKTES